MNHSLCKAWLGGSLSENWFGVFHSCRNPPLGRFHGRKCVVPTAPKADQWLQKQWHTSVEEQQVQSGGFPRQQSLWPQEPWRGAAGPSGTASHTQRPQRRHHRTGHGVRAKTNHTYLAKRDVKQELMGRINYGFFRVLVADVLQSSAVCWQREGWEGKCPWRQKMLLVFSGPWITSITRNMFYLLEELMVLTVLFVSSNVRQQRLPAVTGSSWHWWGTGVWMLKFVSNAIMQFQI